MTVECSQPEDYQNSHCDGAKPARFTSVFDGKGSTSMFGERSHIDDAGFVTTFHNHPTRFNLYPISQWSAYSWRGAVNPTLHLLGSTAATIHCEASRGVYAALLQVNLKMSSFGIVRSDGANFAAKLLRRLLTRLLTHLENPALLSSLIAAARSGHDQTPVETHDDAWVVQPRVKEFPEKLLLIGSVRRLSTNGRKPNVDLGFAGLALAVPFGTLFWHTLSLSILQPASDSSEQATVP